MRLAAIFDSVSQSKVQKLMVQNYETKHITYRIIYDDDEQKF